MTRTLAPNYCHWLRSSSWSVVKFGRAGSGYGGSGSSEATNLGCSTAVVRIPCLLPRCTAWWVHGGGFSHNWGALLGWLRAAVLPSLKVPRCNVGGALDTCQTAQSCKVPSYSLHGKVDWVHTSRIWYIPETRYRSCYRMAFLARLRGWHNMAYPSGCKVDHFARFYSHLGHPI